MERDIEVDPVHPMKGNVIKKSFGALTLIYATLGNSRYTYDNIIKRQAFTFTRRKIVTIMAGANFWGKHLPSIKI